jgi:hypothetical protein
MTPGLFAMLAESFRAVRGRPVLLGVQATGNIVLLFLLYQWLSLPDATVAQIAASLLLGLFLVLATILLHGAALAAFHDGAPALPFGRAFRRLPRLLPWGVAMDLLLCVSLYLWVEFTQGPFWLAPLVAVLALLPHASDAVRDDGPARARRVLHGWRYWAGALLLGGLGGALAWLLMTWAPAAGGFAMQALSMAVRFVAAFAIALVAWLMVVALVPRLAGHAGGQAAA